MPVPPATQRTFVSGVTLEIMSTPYGPVSTTDVVGCSSVVVVVAGPDGSAAASFLAAMSASFLVSPFLARITYECLTAPVSSGMGRLSGVIGWDCQTEDSVKHR